MLSVKVNVLLPLSVVVALKRFVDEFIVELPVRVNMFDPEVSIPAKSILSNDVPVTPVIVTFPVPVTVCPLNEAAVPIRVVPVGTLTVLPD